MVSDHGGGDRLLVLGEVVQLHQGLGGVPAYGAQDRRVARLVDRRLDGRVQGGQPGARGPQVAQPGEHPARDRGRVVPVLGHVPRHPGPVQPPVVVGVLGILDVRTVVAQPQLVAHVDQRRSAEAEQQRVGAQQPRDREVEGIGVAGGQGQLDAGQARGGAADPAVAGEWVALEDLAKGERAWRRS